MLVDVVVMRTLINFWNKLNGRLGQGEVFITDNGYMDAKRVKQADVAGKE